MQLQKWFLLRIVFTAINVVLLSSFAKGQSVENISNIADYPFLKRGTKYEMQSSYDRSGGNDDGFSGKFSVLRNENGNSVIAETQGAGMITRIWFPMDRDYPEVPMGLRNKKIFIYLDGNSKPVIDMPVVEMFNNSNKQFPYPLCGMALGGCWSNLPIPFNRGAKIVIEGDNVRFFHVQFTKYEPVKEIETFNPVHNPFIANRSSIMNPFWHSGCIDKIFKSDSVVDVSSYLLKPGTNTLSFLKGPAILRGFIVKGSRTNLSKVLEGKLIIAWDDEKIPAINVPLSLFFIQEKEGLNSKSLLAGLLPGGSGFYNFFPMAYRKGAKVHIIVGEKCKVEVTTLYERLKNFNPDLTYLHIDYAKAYPTTPGKRFVWLDVEGEGHFAGVYLRANGKSLSDTSNAAVYWTGCLEGDEIFEADGKMVEHGTGTEDYFNAGWNGLHLRLDHAQVFPFHGYTLYDAGKDISRTAAYRWHLPNEVIPFTAHFKASIEVGPKDDLKGNYESISYYYLITPGGH